LWGVVVESVELLHTTTPQIKERRANAVLTGEYRHSVDAKNRLFIPAKHREELGEELIVSRSIRGQLLKVFSLEGWEAYIAPIKQQERRVAEPALRFLHRNAVKVTPDSQGRILLPQSLLDFAEIEKNAVVVGNCDWVEIWSEALYEAEIEKEDQEDLRAKLELFGL
jgi:MraZ protein